MPRAIAFFFLLNCVDTFVVINCDKSLFIVFCMFGHNDIILFSMYVCTWWWCMYSLVTINSGWFFYQEDLRLILLKSRWVGPCRRSRRFGGRQRLAWFGDVKMIRLKMVRQVNLSQNLDEFAHVEGRKYSVQDEGQVDLALAEGRTDST